MCPCSINLTAWGCKAVQLSTLCGSSLNGLVQPANSALPLRIRGQIDREGFSTYRAHAFSHFESIHDYAKPSPAERSHSELIFDLGELGGGVEDAHVVKFRQ